MADPATDEQDRISDVFAEARARGVAGFRLAPNPGWSIRRPVTRPPRRLLPRDDAHKGFGVTRLVEDLLPEDYRGFIERTEERMLGRFGGDAACTARRLSGSWARTVE